MGNLCSSARAREGGAGPEGGGAAAGASGAPAGPLPRLHAEAVFDVCAAGPGRAVSGGEDGAVCLWDWEAGETLEAWRGHTRPVTKVAYAAAGLAFSASRDKTVRSWRPGAAGPARVFEGEHEMAVSAVAADAAGAAVVSGSRDNRVVLWDHETGKRAKFATVSRNLVTHLAWVPGEAAVLQASEDLTLRVWDTRTMKVAQTFRGHNNIPLHCTVAAAGGHLLSCSNGFDGRGCEVRLWERRGERQLAQMDGHRMSANQCAFLEAPAALCPPASVSCSADQTVRFWDHGAAAGGAGPPAEVACLSLPGDRGPYTAVAALEPTAGDPAEHWGCLGTFDGAVAVWRFDPREGRVEVARASE